MIRAAGIVALSGLLAACQQHDSAGAIPGNPMLCAVNGVKQFTKHCGAELIEIDGQQAFLIHHPDGGFRRLIASSDGQHLLAADGADVTRSARKDNRWEVVVAGDRYVVPVPANVASH